MGGRGSRKGVTMFTGKRWDGGCWFRIFGYGLRIADRSKHESLFSERTGKTRVLRIGRWSIMWLGRK